MALPQTTADRIYDTFTAADAHAFLPFIETHAPTSVMWRKVPPKNSWSDGSATVDYDLPTTLSDLVHRLFLNVTVEIKIPKETAAKAVDWLATGETAKMHLHRMGVGNLITSWELEHNGKSIDRCVKDRWRLERNMFDSDEEYYTTLYNCNGQRMPTTWKFTQASGTAPNVIDSSWDTGKQGATDTAVTYDEDQLASLVVQNANGLNKQFYHTVNFGVNKLGSGGVGLVDKDHKITLDCRYEINWWASYMGSNQVLAIRNLRTPPSLKVNFDTSTKCVQALIVEPGFHDVTGLTVTIKDPQLHMLTYNLPPAIRDRDFAFTKQISYYKPDTQVFEIQTLPVPSDINFNFVVQNINRSVQSLVCIVRLEECLQNNITDNYQRAFDTLYYNVAGDGITAKEPVDADFLLFWMKRKYFTVNNLDILADGTVPVYCFAMGLDGHISRPGFGSLNFANFTNSLNMKGTWNKTWLDDPKTKTRKDGKPQTLRLTWIAFTQNIVTYFNGNLAKQLQ
jgi:hypothetical protein